MLGCCLLKSWISTRNWDEGWQAKYPSIANWLPIDCPPPIPPTKIPHPWRQPPSQLGQKISRYTGTRLTHIALITSLTGAMTTQQNVSSCLRTLLKMQEMVAMLSSSLEPQETLCMKSLPSMSSSMMLNFPLCGQRNPHHLWPQLSAVTTCTSANQS